MVSGLRDIVHEEMNVVNLLLYDTSRKIGNYSMAVSMTCILTHDAVPGPKFPRY